jgi:hypothetical protein
MGKGWTRLRHCLAQTVLRFDTIMCVGVEWVKGRGMGKAVTNCGRFNSTCQSLGQVKGGGGCRTACFAVHQC